MDPQRDWSDGSQNEEFINEEDIDNSCIDKFLNNKFSDPLISSEEDESIEFIDWKTFFEGKKAVRSRIAKDEKLKKKRQDYCLFIPGLRKAPPHPKLSALTKDEQHRCMKVLSSKYINLNILPKEFMGMPSKDDYKCFEEKKDVYVAEQQEYIKWATHVWRSNNSWRVLHPNGIVNMIYEAEFDMKAHMMKCYPETCVFKTHIQLRSGHHGWEIIYPEQDMVQVNMLKLPQFFYPELHESKVSIIKPCAVPKPCPEHPCKFKLPNEEVESAVSMAELHRELARYCAENIAQCVASESAVKCILEADRGWALPVSVFGVEPLEGDKYNVVILGSEFPVKNEPAPERSYRAFKHLLRKDFTKKFVRTFSMCSDDSPSPIPSTSEQVEKNNSNSQKNDEAPLFGYTTLRKVRKKLNVTDEGSEDVSDDSDEDGRPATDLGDDSDKGAAPPRKRRRILKTKPRNRNNKMTNGCIGCTGKDTEFEKPTQRSFEKLRIKNNTTKDEVSVIVHCSHKLRNERFKEVLLEPILEYQLDKGGTAQSPYKIQSLEFSLKLRKKADLINVRVDAMDGELVTIDSMTVGDLTERHGSFASDTADALYTTVQQLAALPCGAYILRHEVTARGTVNDKIFITGSAPRFQKSGSTVAAGFRRQLPLAFTYDQKEVQFQDTK